MLRGWGQGSDVFGEVGGSKGSGAKERDGGSRVEARQRAYLLGDVVTEKINRQC